MSAADLACVSGGAVLWAAWGLVLIAALVVVFLAVQHVILRRQISKASGAVSRLRRTLESLQQRDQRLRDTLQAGPADDIVDAVSALRAELRRQARIREKTEERLREQNAEMTMLRGGQVP